MEHGWQQVERVTVPNGGSVAVALATNRPLLEKLTVWASSGARTLTNMTFQPRINGVNLGTSVNVTAAIAATLIYGDATSASRIVPVGKTNLAVADDFVFDILVSNSGGAPEEVTLYLAAIGRDGGQP